MLVRGYTTQSATRGQSDVQPTVAYPATASAPWPVILFHPTEGRRLSWPEPLVTYEDCIPANHHPSQAR